MKLPEEQFLVVSSLFLVSSLWSIILRFSICTSVGKISLICWLCCADLWGNTPCPEKSNMCQIQQATTGRGETYTPETWRFCSWKGFWGAETPNLAFCPSLESSPLMVTVGWPVEQLAVCKWQSPGSVEAASLTSREGMGTVFGHEPFCGTDFHGKMVK